jgi:hypothetical protein
LFPSSRLVLSRRARIRTASSSSNGPLLLESRRSWQAVVPGAAQNVATAAPTGAATTRAAHGDQLALRNAPAGPRTATTTVEAPPAPPKAMVRRAPIGRRLTGRGVPIARTVLARSVRTAHSRSPPMVPRGLQGHPGPWAAQGGAGQAGHPGRPMEPLARVRDQVHRAIASQGTAATGPGKAQGPLAITARSGSTRVTLIATPCSRACRSRTRRSPSSFSAGVSLL